MLIFAVDDEERPLESLCGVIREAAPFAEVLAFDRAAAVLRAVESHGLFPSIAFLDIRMPDMDGLEVAKWLKIRLPDIEIVFVTTHPEYALEAYRLYARGYLLKPFTAAEIREALEKAGAFPERTPAVPLLRIRCFGSFEIFWHGRPLLFMRRQTKEMFAFLIDRKGACSVEEIVTALWEGEGDFIKQQSYVRSLISDLRRTLKRIGMEDILLREHRQLALRRDRVDCDYYRLLAGDTLIAGSFHGKYMSQYSWAEATLGELTELVKNGMGGG